VPKIPQPAPIGELDLSRRRGGYDEPVIDLNRQAMRQMHARVELEIVPGATHLFEEPGALEEVARLARDWFLRHLPTDEAGARVARPRDSEVRG
jgi:hypothetical protein